jgi:hypothetical protein
LIEGSTTLTRLTLAPWTIMLLINHLLVGLRVLAAITQAVLK